MDRGYEMSRKEFSLLENKNLPNELLAELKITTGIQDKILSRKWMTMTLYRMYVKGLLKKTGKKGEYKLTEN